MRPTYLVLCQSFYYYYSIEFYRNHVCSYAFHCYNRAIGEYVFGVYSIFSNCVQQCQNVI